MGYRGITYYGDTGDKVEKISLRRANFGWKQLLQNLQQFKWKEIDRYSHFISPLIKAII